MVSAPGRYRWSSFRCNALGEPDDIVTPHPSYLALGAGAARRANYRALFRESIESGDIDAIRLHTQQQRALGSRRFQAQIEALMGRSAAVRPRGRPRGAATHRK